MYENSEENIGWLRYLFGFIEKDFRTMDTLTDESHGDKLIDEFKQGNCNLPGNFLQTSPKEQKNPMFVYQPTNKQSSSEKPPTNCSNEENSSMCGQIIKTEKMTTSKQGLQVLLIAPLLALAATQNKHIPLFLNNQEDKSTFLQGIDMTLGKQGPVDDHTDLQTDKETINEMMFLKQGKKGPDKGTIQDSVPLKQQKKDPDLERLSNVLRHQLGRPSKAEFINRLNLEQKDSYVGIEGRAGTICLAPQQIGAYEGPIKCSVSQKQQKKEPVGGFEQDVVIESFLDQVFPWEYSQDFLQFLYLVSIDSEASSKKYISQSCDQDCHQSELDHPSLDFGELNDQKTEKQLSKTDENFGKLYQKISHFVTQMAMEDRQKVDLKKNCLDIDSKKVVLLL
eukprot:GFUD01005096.1.p1 GENE.GFUD01005096.1~~GFUD01005096.1.p1  ORF type:complete len:394 (-),score=101.93 GFUD01005096.1:1588-2769(-)